MQYSINYHIVFSSESVTQSHALTDAAATDHLSSICQILEPDGTVVEQTNYDPWGRIRTADTWQYDNTAGLSLIFRGYTGHEMLPHFALINMNGRMYDPALGRMLSPDNYVQDPNNAQNYNRYTYVLNNPLKYTDPSGEWGVLDSWVIGFFKGFFSTGSGRFDAALETANSMALNDIKIYGGLFVSDPNKSFWGRTWEVVSRFTWQAPQTAVGWTTSQFTNTFFKINWVKYKYGATVINSNAPWKGFTLGPYINGNSTIEADANNPLFQHEYGHYLQSQAWGWGYIPRYAIPSARSENGNYKKNYPSHNWHPVEQDANVRAFLYFNENVDGFYDQNPYDDHGWNFSENPININGDFQKKYVDYHNQNHMLLIDKLIIKAKWYDVLGGALIVPGIIIGYINSYHYNN